MLIPDPKIDYMKEPSIKIRFPEFYKYICNSFPLAKSFQEKLYMYYHNLIEPPKCPVCGKYVNFFRWSKGYHEFCSKKCSAKGTLDRVSQTCMGRYGTKRYQSTSECKEKMKKTCIERYGVEYSTQTDIMKEKSRQTCMERYGTPMYAQSDHYKSRRAEITDKYKQTCRERYGVDNAIRSEILQQHKKNTCLDRYGVDSYSKTNEFKFNRKIQMDNIQKQMTQTSIERYGVPYYTQTEEYKDRAYNTKKQNGTFNTSSIEEDFAKWLDNNNIRYIRQYKSEKYPFNCDFYFPDRDIYMEIQGSWVHGHRPYNPESHIDQNIIDDWKSKHMDFYDVAIEIWSVRDPLKRKIANINNIDFREVFSCKLEDVINEYNR